MSATRVTKALQFSLTPCYFPLLKPKILISTCSDTICILSSKSATKFHTCIKEQVNYRPAYIVQ